jgi:hypothetical protein
VDDPHLHPEGEGLKRGKQAIARQMKADGMDTAAISKYTGISKDEIDGLS